MDLCHKCSKPVVDGENIIRTHFLVMHISNRIRRKYCRMCWYVNKENKREPYFIVLEKFCSRRKSESEAYQYTKVIREAKARVKKAYPN